MAIIECNKPFTYEEVLARRRAHEKEMNGRQAIGLDFFAMEYESTIFKLLAKITAMEKALRATCPGRLVYIGGDEEYAWVSKDVVVP